MKKNKKIRTKIACPLCKQKEYKKFWAMAGYRLAKCKNCGMVWDYSAQEDLLSQYDRTYFSNDNPKGGYANYFEGMKINRKTFRDRLSKIARRTGMRRDLLDVGCALGDSLVVAEKMGWKNAVGIEPSKYAYDFAKERGVSVKNETLSTANLKPNSFDVVMYQDVLEHIAKPVEELKKSRKVLRKGGIIFIVTPDIEGLWAKILGPLWYHYKPKEHVCYFTEQTIKKALHEAGFKKVETQKTYHILSLSYILNRLKYYSPSIFEFLRKLISKTPLKNYAFKAYTGELEAWGTK